MKILLKHRYAADVAAVYAMFTDKAELKAKHEALGGRDVRISSRAQSGNMRRVEIARELPAEVPGVLKRFLQPMNHVVQTETWRKVAADHYQADLDIDIDNVPATISGSLDLRPEGGGCVNDIRLDIDCSIPLVGGKLAEFIAKDSKRLIAAEYRYLQQALE